MHNPNNFQLMWWFFEQQNFSAIYGSNMLYQQLFMEANPLPTGHLLKLRKEGREFALVESVENVAHRLGGCLLRIGPRPRGLLLQLEAPGDREPRVLTHSAASAIDPLCPQQVRERVFHTRFWDRAQQCRPDTALQTGQARQLQTSVHTVEDQNVIHAFLMTNYYEVKPTYVVQYIVLVVVYQNSILY